MHCVECGLPYTPQKGVLQISTVSSCPHCLKSLPPLPADGWPVAPGPALKGERGVFLTRDVTEGELLELCWVMPLNAEESVYAMASKGVLSRYTFPWVHELRALCSGLGLLYNHHNRPNTRCVLRPAVQAVEFRALRDMTKGTELRWHYQQAALNRK